MHKTLSNCRTEVCKALGMVEEQCELSMGMSGDFELAVRDYCMLGVKLTHIKDVNKLQIP
jgi:uncharacterized pyridoxal phosphate-containing UPF0001 family protein